VDLVTLDHYADETNSLINAVVIGKKYIWSLHTTPVPRCWWCGRRAYGSLPGRFLGPKPSAEWENQVLEAAIVYPISIRPIVEPVDGCAADLACLISRLVEKLGLEDRHNQDLRLVQADNRTTSFLVLFFPPCARSVEVIRFNPAPQSLVWVKLKASPLISVCQICHGQSCIVHVVYALTNLPASLKTVLHLALVLLKQIDDHISEGVRPLNMCQPF
jgi:hypothetical protein